MFRFFGTAWSFSSSDSSISSSLITTLSTLAGWLYDNTTEDKIELVADEWDEGWSSLIHSS